MFLENFWYVAGFPDEFGRKLVARTFLGQAVVLFRASDGAVVAFEDRCAHRRLPLSLGRLDNDTIECGYHGLVYDRTGACIKVPGQQRIPRGARVRSYPVVDRHAYVWIWMGDPELADEGKIPDFSRLTDPELGRHRIKLHILGNYQLIVDNLLDLSHLPYVHGTTTGNPPVSEDAKVANERHGDTVQVKRWAKDVPPSRTFAEFGEYRENIDMWTISQFQPPSYIRVSYGSVPARSGVPEDGPPGDAIWQPGHWGFQVFHGLTPETEVTTHQFRYILHEKGAADAATTAEFYRQNDQIINEDRVIFEAQQKALSSDPNGATADDLRSDATIVADGGLDLARAINTQIARKSDAQPR